MDVAHKLLNVFLVWERCCDLVNHLDIEFVLSHKFVIQRVIPCKLAVVSDK